MRHVYNYRKNITCSNCQYKFEGIDNFCPNCGQENHSHHAPFKHIIIEFIESLTHFDTKFFNTLKTLVFRPGLLSKDYNEDKRARYVPPVRLYIFLSFVFFFLLSIFSKGTDEIPIKDNAGKIDYGPKVSIIGRKQLQDSIIVALEYRKDLTTATVDSIIKARMPEGGWFETIFIRQNVRTQLGLVTAEDINHTFLKNIGIVIFILMPIFAIILEILYIRRKRLYIEHLIFSVHFHAFIFISLIVALLLYQFTHEVEWSAYLLIIIPFYSTFALKRVYENPWAKTIVKSVLLTLSYGLCISIAMLVTYIISFVQS